MHTSIYKSFKASYYQTSAYLVPALGLWIIFIVWMLYKTNNAILYDDHLNKSQLSKDSINITISTVLGNSTAMYTNRHFASKVGIMTWNLQGLMRDQLDKRTNAVADVIKTVSPDIIFCQELTPSSHKQLSILLRDSYENVIGSGKNYVGYFTGIYYRKTMFILENQEVIPFANSVMDRTQLVVKLSLVGQTKILLALLTTHLESLPRFKKERIHQLKQCFGKCIAFPDAYNVIFAGDLNLEENEDEGIIPDQMKDLWVESGSSEATKYTWDSTKNHNEILEMDQGPRERYDRMYFRNSSPSTLKFESFGLFGKELIKETSYFPSDHWALMSTFMVS